MGSHFALDACATTLRPLFSGEPGPLHTIFVALLDFYFFLSIKTPWIQEREIIEPNHEEHNRNHSNPESLVFGYTWKFVLLFAFELCVCALRLICVCFEIALFVCAFRFSVFVCSSRLQLSFAVCLFPWSFSFCVCFVLGLPRGVVLGEGGEIG